MLWQARVFRIFALRDVAQVFGPVVQRVSVDVVNVVLRPATVSQSENDTTGLRYPVIYATHPVALVESRKRLSARVSRVP
jgi:hypothetical protein